MSEMIQVRRKAQITLPQSLRRKLGIEEGDFLDFQVRDGEVVLKVKKLIDKGQVWFWTERWQEGEREADEDIRAGHVKRFKGAEGAIDYLHTKVKEVLLDSSRRGK